MYICDRLAERERVILVTIFVAIRYRVSTVFQREISFVFKKHGTRYWYRYGTSGTHGTGTYQVRAMYKSLPLNLSRE